MADLCISIRGAESLKDELARVRDNLRDTDANIEKLTGRSVAFGNRPFQRTPDQPRYNANEVRGGGRGRGSSLFALANYDNAGPPPAKRPTGPFGRLGQPVGGYSRTFPPRRGREDDDDEDLSHKPAIQSSVVATPKDTKTRKEAIAEQESGVGGAVGQTRNRRMFGLLLGTLNKFREDQRTKEDQEVKRKAVEQRLEEKQHEERERLGKERQQLFLDRRRQQIKLRTLEQKIELVDMHKAWEVESRNLECFIRTNARPHIFFLPKSHVPSSRAKLEESKRVLQGLVEERRKQLEEEIEEIMAKGDDSKHADHEDDEVSGSENEMDDSTITDTKKNVDAVQKKMLTSVGGDALSDIDDDDDQAHGGIEYGLSEAAGNIDTAQILKVSEDSVTEKQLDSRAANELCQDENTTTVADDAGKTEDKTETAMEITDAGVSGLSVNVNQVLDHDVNRHVTKDRHHGDKERKHRDQDEEERSKKRDHKHRSRDEDRKDRKRDEDSNRRRKDHHSEDRHRSKRDNSRHRRDDDRDRKKSRDDKKRTESKHSRDNAKDSDKEDKVDRTSDKLQNSSSGDVAEREDGV